MLLKSVRSLLSHHCSKNRLSCYLDGQLSEREATRVDEHLDECETCRNDLESLRATVALLRAAPPPCMPRSVVIPESAVAAQCRTRRVDRTFGALRVGAVAVTLVLAVLLSQDAIRALRPMESVQTVAMEMAAGSGPVPEDAAGDPGVLAEAPAETMAALASESVPVADSEQVELLSATEEAALATETAVEEGESAPLAEGTPALEMSDSENLGPEGEIASEQGILAKQAIAVTEDENAVPEDQGNLYESDAPPESPASRDASAETTSPAHRETLWTPLRLAAAALAVLLVLLIGALVWIGRRRVVL